MFDYLTKTEVINLKKFTVDSLNYLGWELKIQIALIDAGELNFDKFFLYFIVKKKIYAKVTLNLPINIDYYTLLT